MRVLKTPEGTIHIEDKDKTLCGFYAVQDGKAKPVPPFRGESVDVEHIGTVNRNTLPPEVREARMCSDCYGRYNAKED